MQGSRTRDAANTRFLESAASEQQKSRAAIARHGVPHLDHLWEHDVRQVKHQTFKHLLCPHGHSQLQARPGNPGFLPNHTLTKQPTLTRQRSQPVGICRQVGRGAVRKDQSRIAAALHMRWGLCSSAVNTAAARPRALPECCRTQTNYHSPGEPGQPPDHLTKHATSR